MKFARDVRAHGPWRQPQQDSNNSRGLLYLCWRDEVWPPEKRGEGEDRGENDQDGERDQDEGERNGSMVKKQTVAQNGGWNVLDPIADNVDYSLNKQRRYGRL